MENIIAVGVALVVGGGILTLVYRVLRGDRGDRELEALDALASDKDAKRKSGGKKKSGKKG